MPDFLPYYGMNPGLFPESPIIDPIWIQSQLKDIKDPKEREETGIQCGILTAFLMISMFLGTCLLVGLFTLIAKV